jgi:hypothetical protein
MPTHRETVEFLLAKLRPRERFSARPMFGEYAIYADGKVVALLCDDRLYVKVLPASRALEGVCEQGAPYPRAKRHYLVDEGQFSSLPALSGILCAMADAMAARPTKAVRGKRPDASSVARPRRRS